MEGQEKGRAEGERGGKGNEWEGRRGREMEEWEWT